MHRILALVAVLIAVIAIATGPRSKAPEDVLRAVYGAVAIDLPAVTLLPTHDRDAVVCTALAIYHESRAEPPEGRQAVAAVVRNRMRERSLSACGVVYENWQFSWTVWPISNQVPRDPASWARSLREAYGVLVGGDMADFPMNHFCNTSIARPPWLRMATKQRQIGGHLFLYIPTRRRW